MSEEENTVTSTQSNNSENNSEGAGLQASENDPEDGYCAKLQFFNQIVLSGKPSSKKPVIYTDDIENCD
jgi:hypothetical protein